MAGSATIGGRPVYVYAQDPTYLGGSLGARHAESIVRVLRLAHQSGVPAIGLVQSGGARMDEGVASLEGYGAIFRAHVASSPAGSRRSRSSTAPARAAAATRPRSPTSS